MDQTIKDIQKERLLVSKKGSDQYNPRKAKVLASLLSDAKAVVKEEGRTELTLKDFMNAAEENVASINKAIKKSAKGGDDAKALVTEYNAQLDIIHEYLPKVEMASKADIQKEIGKLIEALPEDKRNMKSMGQLMGKLKAHFGDTADGSVLNVEVRTALSKIGG